MTKVLTWGGLILGIISLGIITGISKYVNQSLRRVNSNILLADPSTFGLKYSLVSFPSRDGLNLRGWWFETDIHNPVIIMLHGVRANRAEPPERVFGIAKKLLGQGYNVLMFDFRAHGESEGKYFSAGYFEKNDLLGAVQYIRRRGLTGKIGVLGFSMGAAISLMTAAETKEISAVVADSSYIDILSVIKWKFSKWKYALRLFIPAITFIANSMFRIDFTRIKPVEAIKKITVPVFIIHGGKDETIPVEHAYRLRSACRNRLNQLWIVPEASHTNAFSLRTEEYLSRVLYFFNHALALR
jgi:uncharacterized protein